MTSPGAPPPRGPFWTPGGVRSDGPAPRSGGSILLGLGIGLLATVTIWFGANALSSSDTGMLVLLGGPVVVVIAGIVMAAYPATRRTGAGVLIFVGSAILILGGLCLALIATLGGLR